MIYTISYCSFKAEKLSRLIVVPILGHIMLLSGSLLNLCLETFLIDLSLSHPFISRAGKTPFVTPFFIYILSMLHHIHTVFSVLLSYESDKIT
jgi:hypothetical protein